MSMRSNVLRIALIVAAVLAAFAIVAFVAQRAIAFDDDYGTNPQDPGNASGKVAGDINDTSYDYDADSLSVPVGDSVVVDPSNNEGGATGITHQPNEPVDDNAAHDICYKAHWVAWHNGVGGLRFATWHFKQRYCIGQGHSGEWRVTDVNRPNITCDTSAIAEGVGWSCDGISAAYGHYCRWRGNWHGCHVSARKYHMQACVGEPLGCFPSNSYTESMRLVVHYNGTQRFGLTF